MARGILVSGLRLLAIAATLIVPRSAVAQQFGPKDINYLAHLWDVNRPYYERFITGVATFSGIGVVDSTKDRQGQPQLDVDMGAFGQVECLGYGGDNLREGDQVKISGSIEHGPMTAAAAAEINEITRLPPSDPRYVAPIKEKDTLTLIYGTCAVEGVK
jgi:hypothetical protein